MKVLLVFSLAVVAILAAPSTRKLTDDFKELFDLIHFDKILSETIQELQINGQLIEVVNYLNNNNFVNVLKQIRADPNFTPLKTLFTAKNIDIDQIGDTVAQHLKDSKLGTGDGKATLRSFLDEIEKQVSLTSLAGFFVRKELLSADWRDLMTALKANTSHTLSNNVITSAEFKGLAKLTLADGVDLAPIVTIVYEFFGWGKPPAFE